MKVATLNRRNGAIDEDQIATLRALYAGGRAWRQHSATWLPKSAIEPQDLYAERVNLAHYDPHLPGVFDLVAAMVTEAPPKIAGLPDDYGNALDCNADGRNTPLEVWARLRLVDAFRYRRAFAWVERPSVVLPEGASRADEIKAGALKPWLRAIDADTVLDWSETDGCMSWVLFCERTTERTSVETPRMVVIRWTWIDDKQIRRWEWRQTDPEKPEPDEDATATELRAVPHGYGRCPVVCLDLGDGLWLGARMEEPALALFRAANDRDWSLHRAANELLAIASKHEIATPKQGQGVFLRLERDSDGADTVEMVGPSGVAFEHLAARERSREVTLYRVVQQLALAADITSARAQSGESKARDWTPTERLLKGIASVLVGFLTECGRMLAVALDGPGVSAAVLEGVKAEGCDAFDAADLDEALKAFATAVELKAGSPTALAEGGKLQKRRVFRDLDAETSERIDKELEASRDGYGQATGGGVDLPEVDDDTEEIEEPGEPAEPDEPVKKPAKKRKAAA